MEEVEVLETVEVEVRAVAGRIASTLVAPVLPTFRLSVQALPLTVEDSEAYSTCNASQELTQESSSVVELTPAHWPDTKAGLPSTESTAYTNSFPLSVENEGEE